MFWRACDKFAAVSRSMRRMQREHYILLYIFRIIGWPVFNFAPIYMLRCGVAVASLKLKSPNSMSRGMPREMLRVCISPMSLDIWNLKCVSGPFGFIADRLAYFCRVATVKGNCLLYTNCIRIIIYLIYNVELTAVHVDFTCGKSKFLPNFSPVALELASGLYDPQARISTVRVRE